MDENDQVETDQQPQIEQLVVEDKGGRQEPQTIPIERFNEVYARSKGLEEKYNELLERNNQILVNMATRDVRPVEQEPDPLQDMDPDEATRLSTIITRAVEAATKPLKVQINELSGHTAQRVQRERYEQIRQVVGDDQVATRAAKLVEDWQKDPKKGGWSLEDSIIYAAGEAIVREKLAKLQSRNERGQFNSMGAPISQQPGGSGGAAPRRNGRKTEDQMTPDELVEHLEAKLDGQAF